MTHPPYLREKARDLRRRKRLTIDELAERLAVSRTTIFYWVKDIPIPARHGGGWPESARRKGNRAMRAKYRALREAAYDEALHFYLHLIQTPSFRDFLVLYLTEGHRRSEHEVSIANSEPALITLAARWMEVLSERDPRYAVQYHADQDPAEIRSFWGAHLGVDPECIRLQRKSNSSQLRSRTWRCEHGVLSITCGDTYFREAMRAWTDCLKGSWLDWAPAGA